MTLPFELAWEAPPRDLWVAAAGAATLALLAWRYSPRDARLLAYRLGAIALAALALARPTLVRVETSLKRPSVGVWVDSSAWMGVEEGGKTRYASALAWLGKAKGALEENAEVSYFRLSDGAERRAFDELKAQPGGGLRIDRAVEANAGRFDQVWLLSDGVGDLSEDLDRALTRLGAPVRALGVGQVRQSRGVTLVSAKAPDFVFLHDPFTITADWEAVGLAGKRVRARLKRGGEVVAEEARTVGGPYETFTSSFTLRPDSLGPLEYRVEIEPLGLKEGSAREDLKVESIRQKLRILYLCGRPTFEYATLREFIKSDPSNELVSFVILRNQENVSPVPENELSLIPFPAHEIFVQTLQEFDLFIFQDFAFWRFGLPSSYLANVREFVRKGGALLVIGGDNAFGGGQYVNTPIDELLPASLPAQGAPFEKGLFRPVPKTEKHPLVKFEGMPDWDQLPRLDGHHRFGPARQGSTVVAAAPDGSAVFATRPFGKGRVFLSSTPSTWRWKLSAGLDWKLGGFYERFWSRAFDYLTGSLDLKRVRFAAPTARQTRPVATLHVFDESFRPLSGPSVEVQWLRRGGGEGEAVRWEAVPFREAKPGVFQAELAPGRHRLKAIVRNNGKSWGEDEMDWAWLPPAVKFAPLDESLLRKIANQTGGAYERIADADAKAWVRSLPAPKPVRAEVRRYPLWAQPGWLGLLAVLLIGDWYWRRRRGYK